jgi:hypothetical protein
MHQGMPRRQGLSIVQLLTMIVILAAMIAIAHPAIRRQSTADAAEACQLNLTRIENAEIQYALDRNPAPGATVTLEELVKSCPKQLKELPICPAGGHYTVNAIDTTPTCSLAAQGHIITKWKPAPNTSEDLVR